MCFHEFESLFIVCFYGKLSHLDAMPWWQGKHVGKIVNLNLKEKALFHQYKIFATISAACFVCCPTSKSQMSLKKTLNSYLLISWKLQERFEACVITLNPKNLVHKANTNFKDRRVASKVVVLMCVPGQLMPITVKCIIDTDYSYFFYNARKKTWFLWPQSF